MKSVHHFRLISSAVKFCFSLLSNTLCGFPCSYPGFWGRTIERRPSSEYKLEKRKSAKMFHDALVPFAERRIIQMKLADLSTGPDWVVYVGFIIFAVLSIVLISGHGSWLISGYNTASKEEKAKYNEKKLCRTMGIGMSIIAILLLIMGVFENILPAFFVYIALGIILADVVIIIVLGNTICRR